MSEFTVKTPQQLGAILAGYRKERNLTQAELGAKLGVAQTVVSLLEKDPQRASLARVFKLLSALELDLVVRPRGAASKPSEW